MPSIVSQSFFRNHKVITNIIRRQICFLHIGKLYNTVRKIHVSKNFVYCNLCFISGQLKRFSITTSPTVLNNHIRKHGNIIVPTRKRKIAADTIFSGKPIDKKKLTKMTLSHMLIRMFVKDSLPFTTIENKGFQDFLFQSGVVHNKEILPTRVYLSEDALNDYYDYTKRKITSQINPVMYCCLQIDMWTDNHQRNPYIGVILNYIDKDWNKKKISLKTAGFPHPHTANAIQIRMTEILEEYNINKDNVTTVTDNGANIVKALRDMGIKRLPCIGHNIHLLIKADGIELIEEVSAIITKLNKIHRKIIFHKSRLLELETNKQQEELISVIVQLEEEGALVERDHDHGYQQLHLASPTRWSGIYKLCDSFLMLQSSLRSLLRGLGKERLMLTNAQIDIVKDVKNILGFFMEPLTYLQGQSYSTLNKSAKLILETKQMLIEFNPITPAGDGLRQAILTNYNNRLKITDEMILAALLDPSQKDEPFIIGYLNNKRRTTKSVFLKQQYARLNVDERILLNDVVVNLTANLSVFQLIQQDEILARNIDQEIEDYLSINVVADVTVLDWWRQNSIEYKRLSIIAEKYFGISAMSSDVEATFSTMGFIVTARRSSLNTRKVEMLTFLHENVKLLD